MKRCQRSGPVRCRGLAQGRGDASEDNVKVVADILEDEEEISDGPIAPSEGYVN
jgi:hypothetical protein